MSATPSAASRPLWLLLAPAIFLVLWSGGFSIAKLGIRHAEPLTFLALRYAVVLIVLAPFVLILKPQWPRRLAQWLHIAFVGFLIQGVYFGMCYLAFNLGTASGTVAIIVCLQPILVGLIAPYFAREKVSALRWLGLALGLAGAATVILARASIESESILGVLCSIGGLIGIQRTRQAGLHIAEGAGAGAGVAHDHHGGVALGPAFPDIGTGRLLTDRVQLVGAHDLAGDLIFLGYRRLDPDPIGLALDVVVRPVRFFRMT